MKKLLGIIGRLGKGAATIAGTVVGIGGIGAAVAGDNEQIAACITTLLSAPEGIVTVAGVALVLFGVGRKAGWVAGGTAK